jgi:hypothetical protein
MRQLFTLLFLCFFSSWFASLTASAQQTGVITGRVIAEDGGGLANVTVELYPVDAGRRELGRQISAVTGEDGAFKFTDLSPRAYSIGVSEPQAYVRQPLPTSEGNKRIYYRIGDHAVITLIRGAVITGRVTTADGEPAVGAQVNAVIARAGTGRKIREMTSGVAIAIFRRV